MCAVLDIQHHLEYIQQHDAISHTPLDIFLHRKKWILVRSTNITKVLCNSVQITGTHVVFTPEEVNVQSMRADVAMALLMARVDTNRIWLVGRRRSNIMLIYLHT